MVFKYFKEAGESNEKQTIRKSQKKVIECLSPSPTPADWIQLDLPAPDLAHRHLEHNL